MPLIRDYIAEHEQIVDAGNEALRAMARADGEAAGESLAHMQGLLTSHWSGEEAGVFSVMSEIEDSYAAYVDVLVHEHRSLAAFLDGFDVSVATHRERLGFEVRALAEHIEREEDGLFPASLTALSGSQWDRAITAWKTAHPGREMITD